MCSALVEPRPPTFFDLYSHGLALPDEIDDFIDRWHEDASSRASSLPLHEFLGLTRDEYEIWVLDPDVLPHVLIARREARPLPEVMSQYLDAFPLAARASDIATIKALRSWLAKRLLP
ncbi:MAG: hypothetical protein EXR07_00690 [Acetobacteraceae bacterium]|nr:hypothetical protein [Acetobacteraceae bacterium]